MGITVLKIVIWGGKSSVLWSEIANKISNHKTDNLPPQNDNFEDSYPLNLSS